MLFALGQLLRFFEEKIKDKKLIPEKDTFRFQCSLEVFFVVQVEVALEK